MDVPRPMMPRGIRAVILAIAALMVLPALAGIAGAQDDGETTQQPLVFRAGTLSDMDTPNVLAPGGCGCYEMMFLAYDQLFNFDPETLTAGDLGLVTSYERLDDGATWEFQIREGVRWSDGEPLTSSDLAFTFEFIIEKNISVYHSYLGMSGPRDDPPTFETPDEDTLIWRSPRPTFAPIVPPWIPIIPEHIWSEFETRDEARDFENIPTVGTGPFQLAEWEPGQFYRLERNEHYWGDQPVIDEVFIRIFENEEAMAQALIAGEIDFADSLNPTLFNALGGESNITAHRAAAGFLMNLAFNFGGQGPQSDPHPALQDLTVRRAIAHAIDKQALVDRVLLGTGTVAQSVILPMSDFHWEPTEDEIIHYDPEEAGRLLDEAGYVDSDGDGIRQMPDGGQPLRFDMFALTSNPSSVRALRLIGGWLEQVGMEVNVMPVGDGRAGDLWGSGEFDGFMWGWGPEPDPDFMLSVFTTEMCGVWSDGCYSDPAYDRMYEQQKNAIDPEERHQIVTEMQRHLYEDVAEVILYYPNTLQAYRSDRWDGFVPTPAPDGFLIFGWGPYSYVNLAPVGDGDGGPGLGATGTTGLSTGVWIAVAVVILLVAGALVVIMRRRRTAEDRA
jgi:peptide/nickel transport system substrate-binding protein